MIQVRTLQEIAARATDPLRREWLPLSDAEIAASGRARKPFWLGLQATPAFNLDGKRAVFRLPSRNDPFLVYSATTEIPLSSIRLFTTTEEIASDDVPLYAVAGDAFLGRKLFYWQSPLLLQPHQVWRVELGFVNPPSTGIHLVFAGVRLEAEE